MNLHGGVLAGAGILGLWIAVRVVERLRDARRRADPASDCVVPLGVLGTACGLAMLVNPYGAGLIRFLLRTATVPRPEISEWTPLRLMSLPGQLYLGPARDRDPRPGREWPAAAPEVILIFGVTAVLPMALQPALSPLRDDARRPGGRTHRVRMGSMAAGGWTAARLRRGLTVGCLITAVVLIGLSPPRFDCIRVEPFYFSFPARAVALLKRGGVRGNIAVPFDWGEYVIWHLGPAVKVSIDGRRETLYSDESYRQSRDLERGTGTWDALLKTPPRTDLVLAPIGSPTVRLLARTKGWLALYRDTCCVIFAREGLSDLDRLAQTAVPALPDNGGGLCFPDRRPASRPVRHR